jgi:hypothetical protein
LWPPFARLRPYARRVAGFRVVSGPHDGGFGQLIAYAKFDERSQVGLVVERADPRILVTRELVETLQAAPEEALFGRRFAEVDGGVLRILADNGTWVYRLGDWDAARGCFEAEWPD